MHLTRRGYGVVALVVVAEVMALTFGGRALNAIVAPALIALAAGAVHVRRLDRPVVHRAGVSPGFPGDTRTVTVEVEGRGIATLADAIPEGVAADGPYTETSLPAEFEYDLALGARGKHPLGPLAVHVRDVLGLVEHTYDTLKTTNVLVYPPVYLLAGREQILHEVLDRDAVERQEFDSLREYTPGDPLRDVHWKSTAKAPDEIYVTEFADRRIEDSVVVAATSAPGKADSMAAAAASVAVMALEVGVGVELRVPSGTVPTGQGLDHRDRILKALAVTDGGDLPQATDDVDLRIHAGSQGVTLTVGDRDHAIGEMTVSRTNPLADREVPA